MNLTSHALVGAAVAQVFPNHPLIAFWGAFGSHFVLDMVPHFDFTLYSSSKDGDDEMTRRLGWGRPFAKDLTKIILDFVCGLALSWYIFSPPDNYRLVLLLWCALAAMLPDALQFVYIKIRRGAIVYLQRFHIWMHYPDRPERPLLGLLTEIVTVAVIVVLTKFYFN